MSSFDRGTNIRRNPGSGFDRTGVTETLDVPGLPAPGYIPSSGANLLNQALTAMGAVGRVAGQLSDERDRNAYAAQRDADRAQADQEKVDRDLEQFHRGQASLAARTQLQSLQADIAEGKVVVAGDPQEFIDGFVNTATEGLSPAYAEQYREILQPALTGVIRDKQRQILGKQRDENLSLLAEAAVTATPESLANIRETGKREFPTITDAEFADRVFRPAAEAAAVRGDKNAVDALTAAMGDSLPIERQRIGAALESSIARQRRDTEDAFKNDVAGRLIKGESYAATREAINAYGDRIDETTRLQALDQVTAREKQALTEIRAQQKETYVTQFNSAAIGDAVDRMNRAKETGGAVVIEDVEDPQGIAPPMKRTAIVEEATKVSLAQIAQATPNDPQLAFANQVQFLSDNGVTNPLWERTLAAGFVSVSGDLGAEKLGETPPAMLAAFELDSRLNAMNPALRLNHHKDATARNLFDVARTAQKYTTNGDPSAALLMARKAFAKGALEGDYYDGVTGDVLNTALEDFELSVPGFNNDVDFAGLRNPNDVKPEVQRVAKMLVASIGIPAEAAAKEAVQLVSKSYSVVNGFAVYTGGANVPPGMTDSMKGVIADYVAEHPDEGVEVGDLSFTPIDQAGTWVLVNMRNNRPVDQWRESGTFNVADFANIEAANTRRETQAKALEVSLAANNTMPKAYGLPFMKRRAKKPTSKNLDDYQYREE